MKTKLYLMAIILILLGISFNASSQGVSINEDGSDPDASAILDVKSTDKGFLTPRMTKAQISDIIDPANGLLVFNTDESRYYFFDEPANIWKEIAIGTNIIYNQTFVSCGDNLTDTRDGQIYPTVDINGQCWMAKNLNFGTMISTASNQSNNGIVEKYCYNNSTTYCNNLGGLYQWNEMMNYTSVAGGQGICPDGWHVPTDQEWFDMESSMDPGISNPYTTGWRGYMAGRKLKNSGSGPPFNWASGNTGTNESGFTALPGGYRYSDGSSSYNPSYAFFWTSSQNYYRGLNTGMNSILRNYTNPNYGFSVRCIKD